MAAPTIVRGPNFIDISSITEDASYALISKSHNTAMKVRRIEFIGGSDADKLVVKQGADTGPVICQLGVPNAEQPDYREWEPYKRMEPMIDFDKCTLNAGHRVIIEFL